MQTEENYSKLLKENENLTKEASNKVLKENNKLIINTMDNNNLNSSNSNNNNFNQTMYGNNLLNSSYNQPVTTKRHSSSNSSNFILSEESQKINFEYLKNIFIKYLDATAIGNEFQIKILENVLFSLLKINQTDKNKLEEKRLRSSFYYNLWYNARDFLSARIYGNNEQEGDLHQINAELSEENKKKILHELGN